MRFVTTPPECCVSYVLNMPALARPDLLSVVCISSPCDNLNVKRSAKSCEVERVKEIMDELRQTPFAGDGDSWLIQ